MVFYLKKRVHASYSFNIIIYCLFIKTIKQFVLNSTCLPSIGVYETRFKTCVTPDDATETGSAQCSGAQ